MAFTYRQTKGSPLTAAEVDANFYEVESLHDETEGYKDDAAGSAGSAATSETNAAGHATDAETAKDLAQAAANYVGKWSAQTGAALTGISVSHNGAFYALSEDLADITAKEPGVDTEWVQIVMELAPVANPKAMSQAINMTAASSGSNGIKVLNDDNINFGTGDFTLVWDGIVFDYTQDPVFWFTVNSDYFIFGILESGGEYFFYFRIRVGLNNNYRTATVPISLANGNGVKLVASYQRESASSDGLLAFYVDSLLHEAITVSAQEPPSVVTGGSWYVSGSSLERRASTIQAAILYNRALDATDVAYLYKNGIDPADMWGSQTALTSGTLEIGKNYIIDTFETGDDFTNVGAASNEDGVEFTATDTAPTTWTNGSSLRNTGATAAYLPENIQPVPGQWLDASSNKLHALMPAAGCTLMRPENTFRYEYILTWTASAAAQPICGSTQDPVITDNHFIERIITENQEGTNLQNVSIGDESDGARYMASATPGTLNTPTKQTVAAATPDGTNYQLLATPAATATMTVKFIIEGIIL
jgi:hypothetical protein